MKKYLTIFLLLNVMSIGFAQKTLQYGFKIGTSFPTNHSYSASGVSLDGLTCADFNLFLRAGKHVYAEIGFGYGFYKGDYSNEKAVNPYEYERVVTHNLLIPVKIAGFVNMGKSSGFIPQAGIIYQPLIKVSDNPINYSKNTLECNMIYVTGGFDFKFGPILLGANYRYGLRNFFQNEEGKHPQFINICAGIQF